MGLIFMSVEDGTVVWSGKPRASMTTKNAPELKRSWITLERNMPLTIRFMCPRCHCGPVEHRQPARDRMQCDVCNETWNPLKPVPEQHARCPKCGSVEHSLIFLSIGGDAQCQCIHCERKFTFRRPAFDPTIMRCNNCNGSDWHYRKANHYRCATCGADRRSDVATPREFEAEWHELLSIYGVWSNLCETAPESVLAAEAYHVLRLRMHVHSLGDPLDLLACSMSDVIERLAPRRMLKEPPESNEHFGPAVTAESVDDFERIMARMKERVMLEALRK